MAPFAIDHHFWNAKQEKWWEDIFESFANPIVLQKAIDFKFIKDNEKDFPYIINVCTALGVYELMDFQQNYVPKLVCQFLATMHFHSDENRSMSWMVGTSLVCKDSLPQFARAIEYEFYPYF